MGIEVKFDNENLVKELCIKNGFSISDGTEYGKYGWTASKENILIQYEEIKTGSRLMGKKKPIRLMFSIKAYYPRFGKEMWFLLTQYDLIYNINYHYLDDLEKEEIELLVDLKELNDFFEIVQ